MLDQKNSASWDVLRKHYHNLADDYDDFLNYSPDFVRRMTRKMIAMLALDAQDRFVDLGAGTGMYALDIMQQVDFAHPVLLVDPFEEMLAQVPEDPKLETLCLDGLDFATRQGAYDKILIKEAVHHIHDRKALFAHLHERLRPGGRLLLVHIPPRIDYPLFKAAIERSLTWHADPDALEALLGHAGFKVERAALDYRHALPKETYFRMVGRCYMSLLTSFDKDELDAGLEEMAETYADHDVLRFTDHFDFIVGVKA